jgi:hypothetical protein
VLEWLPSLLLVLLEYGASLLVVVVVVVELSLALFLLSTIIFSSPTRLLSVITDELLKTLTEHSEMLLLFPRPFSAAIEGTFNREEFGSEVLVVVSKGGMVEVLAEEEEALGWTMPICCCCFWSLFKEVEEMLSSLFTLIFVVFRGGGWGG